MFHLVYISHTSHHLSEEDLLDILHKSRQFNKKNHVTGMLLYLNEKFIQVLEGEYKAVQDVFRKITSDSRHHKISVVLEGNSEHRIFKDWSMGFKRLDGEEFRQLSGYKDPEEFISKQRVSDESPAVMIFLSLFYKKNLNDYPEPRHV